MAVQSEVPYVTGRQMLRRCAFLAAVFGMAAFAVLLVRLYRLRLLL